jgi:hypothetical protein
MWSQVLDQYCREYALNWRETLNCALCRLPAVLALNRAGYTLSGNDTLARVLLHVLQRASPTVTPHRLDKDLPSQQPTLLRSSSLWTTSRTRFHLVDAQAEERTRRTFCAKDGTVCEGPNTDIGIG